MKATKLAKLLSILLCAAIVVGMIPMGAVSVSAATTEDGFSYYITDGEVAISGYNGSATEVVIPEKIEGCPVIQINPNVFYYNTNITGVTIPKSVTMVWDSAFYCCSNLKYVTLSENLISIGERAFIIVPLSKA